MKYFNIHNGMPHESQSIELSKRGEVFIHEYKPNVNTIIVEKDTLIFKESWLEESSTSSYFIDSPIKEDDYLFQFVFNYYCTNYKIDDINHNNFLIYYDFGRTNWLSLKWYGLETKNFSKKEKYLYYDSITVKFAHTSDTNKVYKVIFKKI